MNENTQYKTSHTYSHIKKNAKKKMQIKNMNICFKLLSYLFFLHLINLYYISDVLLSVSLFL